MIFLDLLAAATEYLCGILIVSAFFPKREGKEKTRITAVILCGLIHILLSMFTNHWNMLPRMVLIILNYFAVCAICCCGNALKFILVILLYWASAFAVDISVLTVCMTVMDLTAQTVVAQDVSYLLGVISSRSLLLSIAFGCRHVIRRQNDRHRRSGVFLVCLILIPLYTITANGVMISNAMNGSTLSMAVVAFSGGLLCINVLLCLVLNKLELHRIAEEEKRMLQSEVTYHVELANSYQESFRMQRKITHEFRNQLAAIDALLSQEEYKRASDYVHHLQNTTQEIVPLINTNHPMADAVLNQKYQQASEKGVGMLLYCNDLSGIPMEDGDLVTLLGNLLDNAISASAKAQEKSIRVRLWREGDIYQMIVRNSIPEVSENYPEQEQRLHGYGTELVTAVLEKYGYPYIAEQIGSQYVFSAILG